LAVLATAALVLSAFSERSGDQATELGPKFVDWKKEDAGSDDMNLHLQVADALAKADGLAEKNLSPVPEDLLREAQQAAEEQRAMPGVQVKKVAAPKLPASLEKMFQQAEAEQQVEKLAKEKTASATEVQKKKDAVKAAAKAKVAQKAAASDKQSKAQQQATEKKDSLKLLKQVASAAPSSSSSSSAPAPAPAAPAPKATAAAPAAPAPAKAAPAVAPKK